MQQRIGYAILIGIIALLIWIVMMGPQKMIKLIFANAIIGTICFAFGQCIFVFAEQLAQTPTIKFLMFNYESLAKFLHSGQLTFELILFAFLAFLVYTSSTISVSPAKNPNNEKLVNLLCIPITLLSFVFAFYFALLPQGIPDMTVIKDSLGGTFSFVYSFMDSIFYRMLAYGVIVILITSQIKIKINFSKKTTVIPDGLDNL